MSSNKPPSDQELNDSLVSGIRRHQQDQEKTYRARALKMYPHICGRCTREFEGKRLKELTVHHKDHNHDNNPADGSNWELLCIYCHENEHARNAVALATAEDTPRGVKKPELYHQPFSALADLLKKK